MQAEAQRNAVPVPAMSVSKRFGRFKDEDEKTVRKAEVKEDEGYGKMMEAWERYLADRLRLARKKIDAYRIAEGIASGVSCSSSDVGNLALHIQEFDRAFSPELRERFKEKVPGYGSVVWGFFTDEFRIFLAALVNTSPESDFIFPTRHLAEGPSRLGYMNAKNITVAGDVGDHFGERMSGGRVIIEGNAGEWLGGDLAGGEIIVKGGVSFRAGCKMTGGSIIIEGDAQAGLGYFMKGGRIEVLGDVRGNAGDDMSGGEIHIHGNYEGVHGWLPGGTSGKIYHGGALIWPK